MGTISKALGKYREEQQPGKSRRKYPAKPQPKSLREAGGSGADEEIGVADVAVADRSDKLSTADRHRSPQRLPLSEGRRVKKPGPVEPAPKARTKPLPVGKVVPPQKPQPVASETVTPESPEAEGRTCNLVPPLEKFDAKLAVITRPYSFEAEQFKLLRSSLLFPSTGRAPRSILVTSTDPGEGKTLISANLAASIALNLDRYVLLIDCDLRRPFLHTLLGFGEHPGLSEYLTGSCPLESFLLKTSLERFSFLSAGKTAVNPAELLNSNKMFKLMNEVRDRYADRLVIIDSPPPMLASETKALARVVDGVLLVIKHRSTKREDAAELVEKIGKDKILGTVMNFMDKQALGYYRAKKYGYKYYGQD